MPPDSGGPATSMTAEPLIGVTACHKTIDAHEFHAVGDKYVMGVVAGARGIPVVLAAIGDRADAGHYDLPRLIERLDGLLVTGSPSNVEPHHYDGAARRAGVRHDPARDATTLPLIRAAVAAGLPLLAVCRGVQELNVAFGGTLHQHLQEVPGRRDHRMPQTDDPDVRYGPRHTVTLTPDGVLAALARQSGEDPAAVMVNSLHGQGIDRVGDGLAVEAISDDGVIEAVCVADAPAFAVGVQWHPEYEVLRTPFYAVLFAAFGDACRARMAARLDPAPTTSI